MRWADLDPNFHMLHSRYYDLGAYCRMAFFYDCGITRETLEQYQIGPIIFREECHFKKEILFGDRVEVDFAFLSLRRDGARWTIRNRIFVNGHTLAAIVTLDGAWMDLVKRKLVVPDQAFLKGFFDLPKADEFVWK